MRRRVVCPRSHPASPYLRRPSGAFASVRSFPRGDDPRNPRMGRLPPLSVSHGPGAWLSFAALRTAGAYGLSGHECRATVCTFKQRCARLEGTHSPPEILTRAPQRQARKPGRLDAVECVASQAANCPPPCGRPATGRTQDPPPLPRDPRAGRAVGYPAEESCPRQVTPPDDLIPDHRRALCFRKARFAAKARPLLGTLLPAEPAPGCL